MVPEEVLKNIRRIQIRTSRMVSDIFAGQYQSVFKGKGMEFSEVREYQPGDDIRSIDWNVTARSGRPFVKKFIEERELTVILLLDVSPSFYFSSQDKPKRQLAAEICSLLAFSAARNNDKVGFIAFSDEIERFVPPRKGLSHILRIVRESLYLKAKGKGTDITGALEYLNKVTTRKTVSFILSDFYDRGFKKALSVARRRHDITAISITDLRETELCDVGIVYLADPESGERFCLDTSSAEIRNRYNQDARERLWQRKRLFDSLGVSHIDIQADVSYARELLKFFRAREKRR
ncbi:MAG: DUF58 domain-containing protein [Candidatus Omnitrophota bacterium]